MYPLGYNSDMRILTTDEYKRWLSKLKNKQAKTRIILKTNQIQQNGIRSADFKHVATEVLELRFHFGAGYRVYCAVKQDALLLLLIGGDKSSQRKDIQTAQRLLDEARKEQQW